MRFPFCRKSFQMLILVPGLLIGLLVLVRWSVQGFVVYFSPQSEVYSLPLLPQCISNNLSDSELPITDEIPTWDELHNETWSKNVREGSWSPQTCHTKEVIAIIVPYRERESHLRKLLSHLHPFLQRQMVKYQIFLIEQSARGIFNKGVLYNTGFLMVNTIAKLKFRCFIFHDVDMLPITDHNIYQCLNNPLHLGAAVDKYDYQLLYSKIIGGVLAMTFEQFNKVNGYSNTYEGWGGEDDDMFVRIIAEKYKVIRYPKEIARYKMIKHGQDKGNPLNPERFLLLKDTMNRYKFDGLNSVKFKLTQSNSSKTNLVHWITVDVPPKPVFRTTDLWINLFLDQLNI